MDRLCANVFLGDGVQMKQETLFRLVDATGNLKPNIDPYNHQKAASNAQSSLAYEKHKASQFHITQKLRIKAYLMAYPGSTLAEISAGTGIKQRGTVSARLDDLRRDGFDLIDNHGHWSLKKRIT